MSRRPIARSPDLQRLVREGYSLHIVGGRLVVEDVPYVDSQGRVHHDGALVSTLSLAGEVTAVPGDHTAHFIGEVPCDVKGTPLTAIINNTERTDVDGMVASCYFSAKPSGTGAYADYHQKVTVYLAHISGPAAAIDPNATPRRFRPVTAEEDDGPFAYIDTASSRAGIDATNSRLAGDRIAIIGLGGTGQYILDLVAKTHVAAIHLFDEDRFLTHNAFRSPGAANLAQLEAGALKVDHFADVYSAMRSGITAHGHRVDESNIDQLRDMSFVFIAIDDAPAKEAIVEGLVAFGVPFIDVGMGVRSVGGLLTGIVRTTTITPERHDHRGTRISVHDSEVENEYRTNIQIAELNALNACLAVIRWKKLRGLYADLSGEHHSTFSIATNGLVNDELGMVESLTAAATS